MLLSQRTADLHIEQLDGETVVYDQRTNAAHCLNAVAAHVWQHIDSCDSKAALIESVRKGVDADADVSDVEQALRELLDAGLLENGSLPAGAAATNKGMTRRSAAKAALAAGVALAFVTTITAPAAAQTISGFRGDQ